MPAVDGRLGAAGRLADLLLEREAALIRAGYSPVPHDFAGLVISDEEIDALLSETTGSDDAGSEPTGQPATGWDEAIQRARDGFGQAVTGTQLATIRDGAILDPLETELLAVVVAVEYDPRRQRLAAFVQNDVNRPRLTLALISRLFGDAGVQAVGPSGRLFRSCLLHLAPDSPWSASQVVPVPALCWAVAGVSGWDPDLDLLDLDVAPPAGTPSPTPNRHDVPDVLVISGADRARRRQLAARNGRSRLTVAHRPETAEGWEALICHATVSGRAPVVESDALSAVDRRWLERAEHLPWVISSDRELPLDCLPRRPWRELYAGEEAVATDADWEEVAGLSRPPGLRLDRSQLELVAPMIDGQPHAVPEAVRRLARGHLDLLTRRVRPRRAWADLVVGDEQSDGLRMLCARWRHRDQVYDDWGFSALPSAGVVALFSGPSGTGKTLAAEVVAAELGLDLYRLDISTVVSKYIGETEKNLEQVFSAAAAGEVLLFFDEADALFGKRSEVSDAHDRYANIEVAYLLQRLEAHDGLVVMATNLQQNLDPAFLRRIDVLVGFPEPDQAQRLAIWRRSFGEAAPVEGVDLDWVAQRFELTGGEIRNVALEAAFRAAGTGGPITMGAVMAALHREQRKGGRLCNRDDFDHWPGRPPDPLSDLAAAPGDRQAPRAPMPPMPPTRRPREARGAAAAR